MPAFSARLHRLDTARLAAIHSPSPHGRLQSVHGPALHLLDDWPTHATRKNLDLRRSTANLGARPGDPRGRLRRRTGFAVRGAGSSGWTLGCATACATRGKRIRNGRSKRSSFWEDIRELCRAALGQTVPHSLPLVIVDEIHNWKNHPTSWWRFQHTLGLRIDRLLGLSATPFQLGPHELISVLNLRRCIALSGERTAFLDEQVAFLDADLRAAGERGGLPSHCMGGGRAERPRRPRVGLGREWGSGASDGCCHRAFSARLVRRSASATLTPASALASGRFLLRHRRDVSHRAWWVGREAAPEADAPSARGSALRWRPGLGRERRRRARALPDDAGGAGTEGWPRFDQPRRRPRWVLRFFREGELRRMLPGRSPEAARYLRLVQRAVNGEGHEHPKVAVTAERAFRAWLLGDKTLVFCFNIAHRRRCPYRRQPTDRRSQHCRADRGLQVPPRRAGPSASRTSRGGSTTTGRRSSCSFRTTLWRAAEGGCRGSSLCGSATSRR